MYLIIGQANWCRKLLKGNNCPSNEFVTTEEGCKQAALALGLSYSGIVEAASYAAGCFSIQNDAFCNKISDPSLTYPERFLLSGGICLNRSRHCIVFILVITKYLSYTCVESFFFIAIVGSWSEWGDWSCTVTCGEGVKIRERTCNNTLTDPLSADCTIDGSNSTEIRQCGLDKCLQGNQIMLAVYR